MRARRKERQFLTVEYVAAVFQDEQKLHQTDYRNPRCACTHPRVNKHNCALDVITICGPTAKFSGIMRCCYLALLLLGLLWCVVEIHSQQTFPYVSFMGQNLSNHSYVNLRLVGNEYVDDGHTLQCHTDLETCCSGWEGSRRGDWYFPNGNRLPFPNVTEYIVENRAQQRVDLRRNRGTGPSGIYRCDIETNYSVQDNGLRETVYVGLYASGGIAIMVTLSDKIILIIINI